MKNIGEIGRNIWEGERRFICQSRLAFTKTVIRQPAVRISRNGKWNFREGVAEESRAGNDTFRY